MVLYLRNKVTTKSGPYGLRAAQHTDEFSMWHLQLSIRVYNHCGEELKLYSLSVSVHRSRRQSRARTVIESMLHFPDNDVIWSESSHPSKSCYITGKIWELEDCVYDNTITAQPWQTTYQHPKQSQTADSLSNNRQHWNRQHLQKMTCPFTEDSPMQAAAHH